MRPTLERFIRALRVSDVPVSVREGLEAHEVCDLVGFSDREILKHALAATVAKTEDEKERFEECFERFFDRDELDPSALEAFGDGGVPGETAMGEPAPMPSLPLADMLLAGDGQAIAQTMEAAANQVGVSEVRFITQRGIMARRMLDEMGLRDLERMIWELRRRGGEGDLARAEALDAGRSYLLDEARDLVARQVELFARPNAERLREEFLAEARLSSLEARDLDRMQRLVRRIAKRLAAKHTRRRRRARRGRLDVRRTIRRNIGHDGVPFDLVWRHKRIDRPRVVAICDVSRSVSAAARFLLLFLYSLNEVLAEVRAFAFSDRLAEVSQTLDETEAAAAIDLVLEKIGFRPTDYGRMLEDFDEGFLDAVDRRTTVIILGDGRSNNTEPRQDLLEKIYRRAKRVIWLNPEPKSFWGTGDSEMPCYVPYCHLAQVCNTVKHLERVVDDLLLLAARGA